MWLAGVAKRQLTTMYIVQAIWEQDIPITPQGLMGRALQAIQMPIAAEVLLEPPPPPLKRRSAGEW